MHKTRKKFSEFLDTTRHRVCWDRDIGVSKGFAALIFRTEIWKDVVLNAASKGKTIGGK